MNPPVSVGYYKKLIACCFRDVERPRGSAPRRRARKRRGARDAALFALAFTSGLKVSELTSLQAEDYDGKARTLHVAGRRLPVQHIPIGSSTCEIINLWIRYHRGDYESLFFPISKKDKLYKSRLTQGGLHSILHARAEQLRQRDRNVVQPQTLNFSALRTSFKCYLKEGGVPDAILRDLMGLRSRRTAPRDDAAADEKMRLAAKWMARQAAPDGWVPMP